MNYLMILMAFFTLSLQAMTPIQHVARVERDILNGQLSSRINDTIANILCQADTELRKRGANALANQIQSEWQMKYQYLLSDNGHGIGDHPDQVLSTWLDDKLNQIIFVIGEPACVITHICDIKTINAATKIVLRPCSFPMDQVQGERSVEYKRHFAGGSKNDEVFDGEIPIIVYWSILAGCEVAGGSLVCGVAATVGEKLMENYVAPPLSDKIYSRSCDKMELGEFYQGDN